MKGRHPPAVKSNIGGTIVFGELQPICALFLLTKKNGSAFMTLPIRNRRVEAVKLATAINSSGSSSSALFTKVSTQLSTLSASGKPPVKSCRPALL